MVRSEQWLCLGPGF